LFILNYTPVMPKVIVVDITTVCGESTRNYAIFKSMADVPTGIRKFRKEINKENKQAWEEDEGSLVEVWEPEYAKISVGKIYPGFGLVEQSSMDDDDSDWYFWEDLGPKPNEYGYFKMTTGIFFNNNEFSHAYEDWDEDRLETMKISSSVPVWKKFDRKFMDSIWWPDDY
jgi:hypothetical protein